MGAVGKQVDVFPGHIPHRPGGRQAGFNFCRHAVDEFGVFEHHEMGGKNQRGTLRKPLGTALLENVQLFGGFFYRPAEIGHGAAVRSMGAGHELGMAFPPNHGPATCKTAGDVLSLDKSQIAHRPFGNTAHTLQIHE
jgi:hypothetical protein